MCEGWEVAGIKNVSLVPLYTRCTKNKNVAQTSNLFHNLITYLTEKCTEAISPDSSTTIKVCSPFSGVYSFL